VIDLTRSPLRYEALSYVWGTEKARQPIKCHGYDVPITQNLEHALRALRHPTLIKPLWVDAVCINQQDLDERVRQIGYMRLVYRHAGRVVVWLGPSNPVTERALARARELCEYEALLRKTLHDSAGPTTQPGQIRVQILGMMLEELRTDAAAQSGSDLIKLLESPYFERVWCIQEVASSRECICKSGDAEFDFFDLLSLTRMVNEFQGQNKKPMSPLRFWHFVYKQRNRVPDKHGVEIEGAVGNMLFALMNMRNFQATDPRDRLFAIFGITDDGIEPVLAMSDTLDYNSPGAARFLSRVQRGLIWLTKQAESLAPGSEGSIRDPAMTPNYTKPVMEVYRDFTRYMVCRNPRVLDVLSQVQHRRNPEPVSGTPPWPSWVPRFDEPQSCSFFVQRIFLPGIPRTSDYKYFAELYDCPPGGSPREPNVLQLDGFRMDEVASVSGLVQSSSTEPVPLQRLWDEMFEFPLFPRTKLEYVGGTERLDTAFFLTLCGGGMGIMVSMPDPVAGIGSRFQAMATLAEHARNQARGWLAWCHGYPEFAYPDLMPRSKAVRDAELDPTYYNCAAWCYLLQRRVFRTSRGYLGLGPDQVKPGDHVVSLFGGHIVYVLRQASPRDWIFVGECYLHHWDLMTGLLADTIRKRQANIPIETFRLV
jgi:hypothetical protein